MTLRITSTDSKFNGKVVTIHQPAFFPWYPFFQKLESADTFVFLTHCQFQKNGYQNRFNIDEKWYTMSTYRGLEPIVDKKYVKPFKDWEKIKKSLSPVYGEGLLGEFDSCIEESLCETNISIITKICKILELKTRLVRDFPTNATSTKRLVEICAQQNASVYLSGVSGKEYLDKELFQLEKVSLSFQDERVMIKKPILDILSEKY